MGEKMSEQKKSKNKQETVKVIFAKNAETVDFGKYHLLYDGGKFKYNPDENLSCSKQLSNNCGVFIINAELDDEIENQDENEYKKFLLIVEPQYGAEFLNNIEKLIEEFKNNSIEYDKENSSEDDFNKLIFTNKEKSIYPGKDTINISEIPENQRKNCIEKINSLINSYNVISGEKISEIKTEEKNAENKDTEDKKAENKNVENKKAENKNVEIPIPTFAFNIANIFEVVARATIKNAIKNSGNIGWKVINGNDKGNEHKVLKEDNNNFYINGTVKPDIIIRKKVKKCEIDTNEYIIIDAKYKSPENKNRMDRLQILAYAYLYDAHIVGHIFPKKPNGTNKELSSYNINTIFNKSLDKNPSDKYKYVELYLDGSLKGNIEKIFGNKNEKSNN